MRTAAFYSLLLLLVAGVVVFFATRHFTAWDLDYASDFISEHRPYRNRPSPKTANTPPKHDQPTTSGWVFDHKRDARNYGLTQEQCNFAFPDLYLEVDRAVKHRKEELGPLRPEDNDVKWRGDGIVRAMIHDNQLYIIDPHVVWDHNHRPRTLATLHSIHRAVSAFPGKLPDIEFSFTVHDFALHDEHGQNTVWAYTRLDHQRNLWLMPDFGFWGWPDVGLRSYAELQTVLHYEEDDFIDKIPKIVWRGSLDVGSKDVRQGLVDHSQGKTWSDVQVLDWSNKTNIEENLITMQDHCRYMFMAQTEGNTYSGRLKYLLNCHSILFSHDLRWIEPYHHLLQPSGSEQNYIKVQNDYHDLPKKMDTLTKPSHLPESQRIADNAKKTFRERYLTPAAEACYWRALIRGWASVQGFTPQFFEEIEEYDKVMKQKMKKKRPRGAPFEAYVIMEEVNWKIPSKHRKLCIED